MLDPLVLLIDLLAVYRLTRLITKDTLLQEIRWWILQRWPNEGTEFPANIVTDINKANGALANGLPVFRSTKEDEDGDSIWLPLRTYKITELLECPWCASYWVAAIVVALRTFIPTPWGYVAVTLAFSALVGLIFTRLDNS